MLVKQEQQNTGSNSSDSQLEMLSRAVCRGRKRILMQRGHLQHHCLLLQGMELGLKGMKGVQDGERVGAVGAQR